MNSRFCKAFIDVHAIRYLIIKTICVYFAVLLHVLELVAILADVKVPPGSCQLVLVLYNVDFVYVLARVQNNASILNIVLYID